MNPFSNPASRPGSGQGKPNQSSVFPSRQPDAGSIFSNPSSYRDSSPHLFPRSKTPTQAQQKKPQPKPTGVSSIFAPPVNSSQIEDDKLNRLVDHFRNQLKKRDETITHLQTEVKLLNESMALCIKLINEMRPNPTQPQPPKSPSLLQAPHDPVPHFGRQTMISATESVYEDRDKRLYIPSSARLLNIAGLKIENQKGKVIFTDSIDLSRVNTDMASWLDITNENVSVKIPQLKNKKCDIFINNFRNYTAASNQERESIVTIVAGLQGHNNKFQNVEFNYETGMLYLKCKGL